MPKATSPLANPFRLPDGPVAISLSGGRTSAMMLAKILEANGPLPSRVEIVFANTGRERPQTIEFLDEIARRWHVMIAYVERRLDDGTGGFEALGLQGLDMTGRHFRQLIEQRRFLPHPRARFCTQELKIIPMELYLQSLGWTEYRKAVGIRWDERKRIKKDDNPNVTRWHPLAAAGITAADVMAFWDRQPFDLKLPRFRNKTVGGNCDGCFLKSERELAALARDEPDRHAFWEEAEAAVRRITGKKRATFRKDVDRAKLRKFVEDQGDWIFDLNGDGIFCQAEGGECTA